jgi:predicted O-methyltransferase YrrM
MSAGAGRSAKSVYVSGARRVRSGLSSAGALPALDRWAGRSRSGTWVRSLLSIYDVGELAALDVPWWTFESSALVDAFLRGRRGARVFEWGSGASTLWLARRSASVTAVEHDGAWAAEVRGLLGAAPSVDLRVVPAVPARGVPGEARSQKEGATDLDFRAYVDTIDEVGGRFDLVVVDGRAREECLVRALAHLADDGLVVLDNVERARYRAAIAAITPAPEVQWTRGLTPGLPYPTRTALLRPAARG